MHKSYMHCMETVCDKIFGETLAIVVDESGMRPVISPIGKGTSSHGAAPGIFRTHNEPGEPTNVCYSLRTLLSPAHLKPLVSPRQW